MQPGVTVVLATVWLYASAVGTASFDSSRLSLDQYSPLAPRHHEHHRRVGGQLDWKDQSPAENQPFDLSIGPRRSSSVALQRRSFETKQHSSKDSSKVLWTRGNTANDDFSPLVEDKGRRKELTDQKIDGWSTKDTEPASVAPYEPRDPFVADDTFQDQGPGSMEIYKLDLIREKSLLSPTLLAKYPSKGKGKPPKKTNHVTWKSKMSEYKPVSPRIFHKQSNSFDDLSAEVPPNNDPFSIGGVPELQVGCEGLEASDHDHKRSIDSSNRDNTPRQAMSTWPAVTPISLELDYDFSSVEEGYEEMDELVRLKKLETTTSSSKRNRGDMEATHHSEFLDDKPRSDKLPVRGDLGKLKGQNSTSNDHQTGKRFEEYKRTRREAPQSEEAQSSDGLATSGQRRRLLWLENTIADQRPQDEVRSKREIWGFGEDEGVVSSDELQTVNQRRRADYERRRKEEERRRLEEVQRRSYITNRTNSDVERIRQEYERALEERKRQEEDRQRRLQQQQQQRTISNDWRSQNVSERRLQEPDSRAPVSTAKDDGRGRAEVEALRRRDQETRRIYQQEVDRRNLEQRKREWLLKRRQEEDEMRRRQRVRDEPSNLLYPMRAAPNETRPYREQERERQEKLREYVQRNRPINLNPSADRRKEAEARQREDEQRKRLEEERKLQEYVRRNQPINVNTNRSNDRAGLIEQRNRLDGAGAYNWSRYPGPGSGRRSHGPSAPTDIDPRGYAEQRRQAEAARRADEERVRETERRDRERLRAEARRREDEARRAQSRRYEAQRKRQEAARKEAERRWKELMEEQARRNQAAGGRVTPSSVNTRRGYEDRSRVEEHRRGQDDTSLIPANLLSNETGRGSKHERQRQEQERRRAEAERRRQEESRAKEEREREQRARVMKEQWRRQEEARLNALPVSARIIVHSPGTSTSTRLSSRTGFDGDIDFPGANPYRRGAEAPNFPAPATRRPPVKSPPPCIWAIVQCCPFNNNRLVTCFESLGCPGVNWDPNPCRGSITKAAREQVMKFYDELEAENRGF